MNRLGKLLSISPLVLTLTLCTTLDENLKPFHPHTHGTAHEEWQPHQESVEWWYATGALAGGSDDVYAYQFTIFHLSRQSNQAYALHLAFSDYQTGQHIFEEEISFSHGKAHGNTDTIVFENSRIEISGNTILIHAEGKELSYQLTLSSTKPPAWHGQDGIIVMARQEEERERSFYYSFTNMDTEGSVTYRNEKGEVTKKVLTGKSWFDRQWGAFTETGWDWFSIRFFDDEEIMLFSFPKTGHRDATYVNSDGRSSRFSDFSYTVQEWVTHKGKKFGLGWTLSLPVKERDYSIVPLSHNDFNFASNRNRGYWEGLCVVYNGQNEKVGYCMMETTSSAYSE